MLEEAGKSLIIFGVVIVILGILLTLSDKLPFLGKLPGDFQYKGGNFSIYAPIATSIVVSILLTILVNLIIRIFR